MPNVKLDKVKGQRVSAEEGVRRLAADLLETTRRSGDVASEETWQGHAILLLRHGEHFLSQVGMAGVLKMQQQCADMIIKIRLAGKKAPPAGQGGLEEYEGMLAEIFAQEGVPEEGVPEEGDEGPAVPVVVPGDDEDGGEEEEAGDDDED